MATSDFRVKLVFTTERGQHETMDLDPGSYIIGRSKEADVRVPPEFKTVSRQHAKLVVDEAGVVIEDLGSHAGLMINGEIVTRQEVEDGDVITLGELGFRVHLPERQAVVASRRVLGAMSVGVEDLTQALDEIEDKTRAVFAEVAKRIVGQNEIIRQVWAAILARGHCLMIGVPGLAKTLLVNTLAEALQLTFNRIQFTPDLMPADIIGSQVIHRTEDGRTQFQFEQGPLFTQLLLADEINRTPPKTQAALLQAMQEREVTVSRNTYTLRPPFCVIATQNPIEQEGTYPLPEAQQDRFMFCLILDYPDREQEIDILLQTTTDEKVSIENVLTYEDILRFQQVVDRIAIGRDLVELTADIARSTRPGSGAAGALAGLSELIDWGAGPRAGQAIIMGAKALAAMEGRPAVCRNDVLKAVKPVLRHRIGCNYRAKTQGLSADDIIDRIMEHFS